MRRELRADVADAIVAHGLRCFASAAYDQPLDVDGKLYEMAQVKVGSFMVLHTRPRTGDGFELFDVFQKGKMFSMRKPDAAGDWELVSMKRGDWESAFLLT